MPDAFTKKKGKCCKYYDIYISCEMRFPRSSYFNSAGRAINLVNLHFQISLFLVNVGVLTRFS